MSVVQRPARPIIAIADGYLLTAQTTNTNGVWAPLERVAPWSLTVRGVIGTATVTIYVSNQMVRPSDSDNNQAVLQTFNSLGTAGSNFAFRWIKAAVSGAGGGTSVTVDVMAGQGD